MLAHPLFVRHFREPAKASVTWREDSFRSARTNGWPLAALEALARFTRGPNPSGDGGAYRAPKSDQPNESSDCVEACVERGHLADHRLALQHNQ